LSEKSLIVRIRGLQHPGRGVIKGIGDDCAVLRIPSGHEVLVTTDFSLEEVHFRRKLHSPEVVGHRCLTRGLSDIAAMGAQPIAAFLSLALPRKLPQAWVDGFLKGLLELAHEFGVSLAGGDTAESRSGILADIVVVGSAPKGTAVRRSGARAGDWIYVSGQLGGSAATLRLLFSGRKLRPGDYAPHFHPMPRIQVGQWLRQKKLASAMIDISDGLSTDLSHICEESRVGAEIVAEAVPRAMIGRPLRQVDLDFALHGGDDYELLFTAAPEKRVPTRIAGVPISRIGQVRAGRRMILKSDRRTVELKPEGWQHFQK
jgi:thiamine-monophosphate kinase